MVTYDMAPTTLQNMHQSINVKVAYLSLVIVMVVISFIVIQHMVTAKKYQLSRYTLWTASPDVRQMKLADKF